MADHGTASPLRGRTAAVLGAGTMGHAIALVQAVHGATVWMWDVSDEAARRGRDAAAASLAGWGIAETQDVVIARIRPTGDLATAVCEAAVVTEAVPEVLEIKRDVWSRAAAQAPAGALLATNTSSFDVDAIAAVLPRANRFLGTHWYNPAHLVPCVEVVPGKATDDDAVDLAMDLLSAMGKTPVRTANRAGFVGNRLQFALIAEAFRCVDDGVVTPADVDAIVRSSFGLRLSGFGPFEVADLGGLDTFAAILSYLADELGEHFRPSPALRDLVAAGRCGVKSGSGIYEYDDASAAALRRRRDAHLLAVLGSLSEGGGSAEVAD